MAEFCTSYAYFLQKSEKKSLKCVDFLHLVLYNRVRIKEERNNQMNEIMKTQENIKRIEAFVKHIKMNFNDHKKQAKTSQHLDEIENSIAFLKDYNEVCEQLIKVIEDYDIKTAGEIIH